MIRQITIRDARNNQGFDRYKVTVDNGKSDILNPPVIGTNNPVELFGALVEFLRDRE